MNDTGFYEAEREKSEESIPSIVPESEERISSTREESLSELKVRLENCERRYNDLKMKNEELHYKTVDLTTELEREREENRNLRGQLDSANAEISRLGNERDSWKQKFEECRGIAEGLRTHITELKREKTVCEDEKQQLMDRIKRLEEGKETYRKNNENLENTLESQMQKSRYRIQELEEKNKELELSLDEKNKSLTECKQRLDVWEEEKRQLEREIENLQEKIRNCKAHLEEFKRLCERVSLQPEIGTTGPESPIRPQQYEETPFSQPEILPEPSESKKEYPWDSDRDEENPMSL